MSSGFEDLIRRDGRTVQVSGRIMSDPALFELEMERIFPRTWVFVAHESEIPDRGNFVTRWIGSDSVIVTRTQRGDVAVLLNMCTHRGTRLCVGDFGSTRNFKCPYHGWTYAEDGRLVGVPYEQDLYSDTIDRADLGLRKARVEVRYGLVFATWNQDAPALVEHLGAMDFYMAMLFDLTDGGMEVMGAPQRWIMDANWKLAADNFCGDFAHTGTGHASMMSLDFVPTLPDLMGLPGIIGISDPDRGHSGLCLGIGPGPGDPIDRYRSSSAMAGIPPELADQAPRRLTPDQLRVLADNPLVVGTIFPNFSFLPMVVATEIGGVPEAGLSIRLWHPIAAGKTEIWMWCLAPRDASREAKEAASRAILRTFGSSGMFEQDDTEIWARIQAGVRGVRGRDEWLQFRPHLTSDPTWPYPGFAHRGIQVEHEQVHFYEHWLSMLECEPSSAPAAQPAVLR